MVNTNMLRDFVTVSTISVINNIRFVKEQGSSQSIYKIKVNKSNGEFFLMETERSVETNVEKPINRTMQESSEANERKRGIFQEI